MAHAVSRTVIEGEVAGGDRGTHWNIGLYGDTSHQQLQKDVTGTSLYQIVDLPVSCYLIDTIYGIF